MSSRNGTCGILANSPGWTGRAPAVVAWTRWFHCVLAGLMTGLATGVAPSFAGPEGVEYLGAEGQSIAETAVPEDLRRGVQEVMADPIHGIDFEKCALVLARAVLPGDEGDTQFASALQGDGWTGGLHYLTARGPRTSAAAPPANATFIRLCRFDGPCTLELSKPGYRPVTMRVPAANGRGHIIWMGEIALERDPSAGGAVRKIAVAPPDGPIPPVGGTAGPADGGVVAPTATPAVADGRPEPAKAPAAGPAATLTPAEMNRIFAVPLWGGDRLWDENCDAIRQRLRGRVESPGEGDDSRSSFLAHPQEKILGAPVENLRITCTDGTADSVMIVYANKGDSIPGTKLDPKDFKHPSDYNQAVQARAKALAMLDKRLRDAATNVEQRLTAALGKPRHSTYGAGGPVQESVLVWSWNDHTMLLSEKPHEGVILRMMPVLDARAKGRSPLIRSADLKKDLLDRVQRRANGDVVVGGIPMVNQGAKGYCVPATWARYLIYLGISVDEYILAEAAHTGAGGGTNLKGIVSAAERVLIDNHRRLVTSSGPLTIPVIERNINEGMPMMWEMSAVQPFEQLGLPAGRMGNIPPKDWSDQLKTRREEVRKLSRYKHSGAHAHMCLIIGYNKATQEIATSDSWGPATQERWFPLEAAQSVSRDSYRVIHW